MKIISLTETDCLLMSSPRADERSAGDFSDILQDFDLEGS